jgi:hypothetical protein
MEGKQMLFLIGCFVCVVIIVILLSSVAGILKDIRFMAGEQVKQNDAIIRLLQEKGGSPVSHVEAEPETKPDMDR